MNKLNYLILLVVSSHLVIVNCGILGEFLGSFLILRLESVSILVSNISVLAFSTSFFLFLQTSIEISLSPVLRDIASVFVKNVKNRITVNALRRQGKRAN